MACAKPVFKGQSPVKCHLCEVETKIQWKCEGCELLLCTNCKDKIPSKVKTAKDHRIINIKEVGTTSDQDTVRSGKKSLVGTSSNQYIVQSVKIGAVNVELSILQEYQTNFCVHYVQASLDDSLWIGSVFHKKFSKHLTKVKPERDNLKTLSKFNVDVYDIAITPSNDLIMADLTPKLKQIVHNSNKVTESIYCVEPYNARCVHVTRDNKVVVGADLDGGVVYVMDMNGTHEKIYRRDHNNEPIFTFAFRITSTCTDTLCVIDILSFEPKEGRLVMLGQGEVISVYTGHPNINTQKKRFKPWDVVSTSNDNIIVTDPYNYALHILNNTGSFLTCYDTWKIIQLFPASLAFYMVGHLSILYIGCTSGHGDGKLYKLTLSGC